MAAILTEQFVVTSVSESATDAEKVSVALRIKSAPKGAPGMGMPGMMGNSITLNVPVAAAPAVGTTLALSVSTVA